MVTDHPADKLGAREWLAEWGQKRTFGKMISCFFSEIIRLSIDGGGHLEQPRANSECGDWVKHGAFSMLCDTAGCSSTWLR